MASQRADRRRGQRDRCPDGCLDPAIGAALYARAPELAGHRVFMFMGRVAPIQKGLDLLVQGWSLANIPDCRLVLLGPDWRGGRASLECLVTRLGLRSQVVFLDSESPQRCADLMAGADVFVHTVEVGRHVAGGAGGRGLGKAVPVDPGRRSERCPRAGGRRGRRRRDPREHRRRSSRPSAVSIERSSCAMGQRAHCTVVTQFTWNRAATTLIEAYRHGCGLDRR